MALGRPLCRAGAISLRWHISRPLSTMIDDRLLSIADASPLQRNANDTLHNALQARGPRHDWTREEIRNIYNIPLMELAHQSVHTSPSSAIACKPD